MKQRTIDDFIRELEERKPMILNYINRTLRPGYMFHERPLIPLNYQFTLETGDSKQPTALITVSWQHYMATDLQIEVPTRDEWVEYAENDT